MGVVFSAFKAANILCAYTIRIDSTTRRSVREGYCKEQFVVIGCGKAVYEFIQTTEEANIETKYFSTNMISIKRKMEAITAETRVVNSNSNYQFQFQLSVFNSNSKYAFSRFSIPIPITKNKTNSNSNYAAKFSIPIPIPIPTKFQIFRNIKVRN